jgi:hypothetical protein
MGRNTSRDVGHCSIENAVTRADFDGCFHSLALLRSTPEIGQKSWILAFAGVTRVQSVLLILLCQIGFQSSLSVI